MTASIRVFCPADLPACMAVFDSNVPEYFRDHERDEFEAFLGSLPGPYFVLEEGETIVACGGYAVRAAAGEADLCWGMVRRSRHGRGYGRLLSAYRLEEARKDPELRAVVLSTSQHTVGFYRKLGFSLLRTDPDGFGSGLDRCEMRLRLDRGEGRRDAIVRSDRG